MLPTCSYVVRRSIFNTGHPPLPFLGRARVGQSISTKYKDNMKTARTSSRSPEEGPTYSNRGASRRGFSKNVVFHSYPFGWIMAALGLSRPHHPPSECFSAPRFSARTFRARTNYLVILPLRTKNTARALTRLLFELQSSRSVYLDQHDEIHLIRTSRAPNADPKHTPHTPKIQRRQN